MWKRFLIKRRSVILTWLLSYLAILMVPIMVSLFVYDQSKDTLKSEIHRANDALLKELGELLDNQVDAVKRLTTELMWSTRVRDLMYSNWYNTEDGMYDLYLTTKEMSMYQVTYPSIKSYYVYWAKRDLVLLPNVYRDSRLAFETVHEKDQISYELWRDILKGNNQRRFLKLNQKEGGSSSLAYLQSFAGDVAEGTPGTAVVLLDTSELLQAIRGVQSFSGGEVLVLDRNDQVLLSTAAKLEDSPFLMELPFDEDSGSFFHEFNGQQSEFMYIKSDNSDLTFVTVIPSRLFWEKAQYVRNVTLAGLSLSLLGGIALTAVLIRKNYGPVRLLTRMLGTSQPAIPLQGNEFLYIRNAIANTLNEKEQIQLRMKQQSNLLRSNLLARLLQGKEGGQLPVDESLAAFQIDFYSEEFAVILFYLDYAAFFAHVQGDDSSDKLKLMHFIVTNIVEELVRAEHSGFVCEIDNSMACLVNLHPGQADPNTGLRQIAEGARRFLQEKFKINSTVSISGVKQTVARIPLAYREAVDTLEYMIVVGEEGILSFDEVGREDPDGGLQSSYYYPIQVEQQLMNHLKAGDGEKAEGIIKDIITRNVGQSKVSVGLVRCLMFNLTGTFIKTISEIGDVNESLFLKNQKRIEGLIACESIKEMEHQLTEVVREVCDYAEARQRQQQMNSRSQLLQERSGEIMAYIRQNYSDVNLNISMIGQHFKMTPTYLSKLFKEQTGNGLLDAINQVRIEQAKVLLGDQRNNIREVSLSVGFHDINTFIRIFKKLEGVTPGQYQKIAAGDH